MPVLTARQREVLAMLLKGHNCSEIAAAHNRQHKSVCEMRKRLWRIFGVENDAALGAMYARLEMVGVIKAAQAVTGAWGSGWIDPDAIRNLAAELEKVTP